MHHVTEKLVIYHTVPEEQHVVLPIPQSYWEDGLVVVAEKAQFFQSGTK